MDKGKRPLEPVAMSQLEQLSPYLREAPPPESIAERCICAAAICIEAHFLSNPPMGPLTKMKVGNIVGKILDKTQASDDVR